MAAVAGEIRAATVGEFWVWIAGACAAALWATRSAVVTLAQRRLLQDTPTTRLRSAAQGFVEISGTARLFEGEPVLAPLTQRRCCWYRYRIDQRSEHTWKTVDEGTSEAIFRLEDGDGHCAVDPDGATVTPSVCQVWYGALPYPSHPPRPSGFEVWFAGGAYRYREERIDVGSELCAVGYLRTHGGAGPGLAEADAAQILREWKTDRAGLLARYDADKNGEIDAHEWERARTDAQALTSASLGGTGMPLAIDLLSRSPLAGQPFLLAAGNQDALERGQTRRMLLAFGAVMALAASLYWALAVRF